MMTFRRPVLVVVLAALIWSSPAAAHKFWIEPESHLASVGDTIYGAIKVGGDFEGERLPYISDFVVSLTATGRDGRRDIEGFDGDDPAVRMEASSEGLLAISYHSTGDIAEFDDNWDLFNEYLVDEGLPWVAAAHRRRGLSTTHFSEIYYRCAKALIQVGRPNSEDIDRYTGMPFELVVDGNPYRRTPTDTLGVKLLWNGEPYPDAQVSVVRHDGELHKFTRTTDAEGRIDLPLTGGGRFLLASVHMQEAPDDIDPVWESHWASLTFAIADTEEVPADQ